MVALLLLLGCGGGGETVTTTTTTTTPTTTIIATTTTTIATTTTTIATTTTTLAPVVFSDHVTDLTKIAYLVQAGSVSGDRIATHNYLSLLSTEATVEVFAPVGAELVAIGYYIERADSVPEYSLFFQVDDNVYYYFDHLVKCSPKIEAVAPATPRPDSTTVAPTAATFVAAGEFIASAEGTLQARTWDFGAYDLSHANPVANLTRYSATDRYVTGLNAFSYYPAAIRDQYLAIVGTSATQLYPTTECQSPCRDVVGTAAGYWYLDAGTDATYTSTMPLASRPDGSVRWGGVGGGGTDYRVMPDPVTITVGAAQCYEDGAGNYLFIELLSSDELGVYYGSGATPETFPTSGYKSYVR